MGENNIPTALKNCGVKMLEWPEMYELSSPVTEATEGGLKLVLGLMVKLNLLEVPGC